MAEDRKPPLSGSLLAPKGTAQPWTRRRDEETKAGEQRAGKRPQGLHNRPDLFGSSAVLRRPQSEAETPGDENGLQRDGEPAGDDAAAPSHASGQANEQANEQAGGRVSGQAGGADRDSAQLGADDADAASRTPTGPLDHPVRITESASFEDWPDGSRAEADHDEQEIQKSREDDEAAGGATQVSASWVEEVEAQLPELADDEDEDEDEEHYALAHGDGLDGPDEDSERRAGLAASLQLGGHGGNRNPGRWALTAGAVACGALLLAAVVGGVIPLSDDDAATRTAATDDPSEAESDEMAADGRGGPDTSEPAAAQTAAREPAADPKAAEAGTSEPVQAAAQDLGASAITGTGETEIPVLPAAGDGAGSGHILPSTAGPSGPTSGSQMAALPDPRGPDAGGSDEGPIVDFMRIDPDGRAVVAGRAAPGTRLVILDNGEELGSVTADIYGLWTFVSAEPMQSGRHEIGLKIHGPTSELSPTVVTDAGPAVLDPTAGADMSDPLAESEPLAGGTALAASDLSRTQSESLAKAPETTASDASEAGAPAAAVGEPDMPVAPRSGIGTADPAAATETAATETAWGVAAGDVAQSVPAQASAGLQADGTAETPAAGGTAATESADAAGTAAPATATAPAEETRTQVSALPEELPKPAAKPASSPATAGSVQTAAATPAAGRYVVQLASFRNASSAARETAILEQRYADLLSGLELFVEQAKLENQNTVYRVRTGPFASLAEARTTCARFKERDRDCLAMRR